MNCSRRRGSYRNRMYWEGSLEQHPNVRPFSIQRNGYAGLQQYGFLWSGDVNSAWQTLRTQIAAGLNTALSGIPYWGTDTGGFFSTKELTAELYVRWFQFSAFCPLFRSHGRTWMLRLPWGWNRGELGPVEDDIKLLPAPEDLHHPEVEEICRKYLNLRYQLLPYLYSAVHDTHQTGMPLMRALWFSFPGDSAALAVDDAYMWGESLLVAPVTSKSATEHTVYLPRGSWFDYWTSESTAIAGGTIHTRAVDLATLPLYVKAGTILPLGPIKQSTLEPSSAPLELHIYPGADARFALYEDDGISMDHTRGISSTIEISWNDSARTLSLARTPGAAMHPFTTRKFSARIVGSRRLRRQAARLQRQPCHHQALKKLDGSRSNAGELLVFLRLSDRLRSCLQRCLCAHLQAHNIVRAEQQVNPHPQPVEVLSRAARCHHLLAVPARRVDDSLARSEYLLMARLTGHAQARRHVRRADENIHARHRCQLVDTRQRLRGLHLCQQTQLTVQSLLPLHHALSESILQRARAAEDSSATRWSEP